MGELNFPLETRHFFIQPGNREKLWEEEWTVTLKNGDHNKIGSFFFENANFRDEVKITLNLDKNYEKSKYSAEILYEIARFVFRFNNIREISTVCRYEDEHRVRGLERAGYVRRQTKDGDVYYSMKKQKTAWTGVYVFVGLVAGFMMGIVISNLWVGTIAGIIIGIVIGYLMDKKEKREDTVETEFKKD